ncbi:hypothetical protein FAES_0149 [Fibrella aestuarina BUZ 2]|uniref:Uncharacterized protein n=1 Tax=Fibrella aestuarina BUZ 2 TaxID=1166018 RepID=I0K210_9BACT|nr:hypothetical protein FAES_0149 [Fibrella aestuarina BUZ 2]
MVMALFVEDGQRLLPSTYSIKRHRSRSGLISTVYPSGI